MITLSMLYKKKITIVSITHRDDIDISHSYAGRIRYMSMISFRDIGERYQRESQDSRIN